MRLLRIISISIISIFIVACTSSYDMPEGWYAAGSHPKDYAMGTDKNAGMKGNNAATIKSNNKSIDGFGTMMQSISPEKYRNKHLQLTGFIKTNDVKSWAGFWVRVDQENSNEPLSFDNMYDRALKDDNDWTKCEIVVDVPGNASNISFGALLHGTGQIWFDEINMEAVDTSVALTGTLGKSDKPKNLNFDE